MAKQIKSEQKPEQKTKREPKPLATLGGESLAQMNAIDLALREVLGAVERAKSVPNRHLQVARSNFAKSLSGLLKSRRGDATARKRSRLEQKLAKIQAEIAALNSTKK